MFEVNNYVVKYNSGVCKVEDVLDGQKADFKDNKMYYLLIPLAEKSARIYIPLERGEKVLRRVLTYEEATELISRIPSIGMEFSQNDKLRELEYKEALQSLDCERMVQIIKDIYGRKKRREIRGKKTTATDEKYFRQAEHALYMELAFSLGCREEDIPGLITEKIKTGDKRES
ncbi:CarD family transcriptional regulator [Marvinbryantia formatexigens]|nr:CarD family transcriptional regulator [Marvinbryantia formatexigens]UWO25828.1 CarD family transcriptional regulator [Marvinbryantia formatexigens DSM 14469]SDF38982.1 transcriptional regulator, CarD family [Marvinbryantia formatexigens]